ncbi:hypothetical protein [Methylobacterium sp. WL6]|uniref:hypothetical protein n=1 Tax=Methylobacterium sp. WL6 TaxID=2603901 RepID=UPI0016501739|nr:hypothetical protein [Methylobacterium sp. WL6]
MPGGVLRPEDRDAAFWGVAAILISRPRNESPQPNAGGDVLDHYERGVAVIGEDRPVAHGLKLADLRATHPAHPILPMREPVEELPIRVGRQLGFDGMPLHRAALLTGKLHSHAARSLIVREGRNSSARPAAVMRALAAHRIE